MNIVNAKREGHWAYHAGRDIDENPFSKQWNPELAKAWREGYMRAWYAENYDYVEEQEEHTAHGCTPGFDSLAPHAGEELA